jgi:hypothetical protein
MKKNGYINATKLCNDAMKETGSKKPFRNWYHNKDSKKIIDVIVASAEISADALFIEITGGKSEFIITRRTYVHSKLIPHIASWTSPIFAIKVSDIVNQYYIDKAIRKKDELLRKKDDKIDTLSKKIDTLLENNKKLNGRVCR